MKKSLIAGQSLIFFTILALANVSEGATVRKGPYLIYPGNNTEMTVLWQLDSSQTCTLEWGLDTSYSGGSVATNEYGTDHQYKHTITGLTPGNKYYYRVTVDPNQYIGSFRAAPPEDVNEFKFLAYGDTRTGTFVHDMVDGAMVNTFKADPNYQTFTLLTGDWVNNGKKEEDWDEEFFNPAALNTRELQANLPINGCIGNHDWGSNSTPPTLFDKYWPYPYVDGFYWSFDYGPAHIAVVDQHSEEYHSSSEQYSWLEHDLATTDKDWKFLMFHKPGYSAGGHHDDSFVQKYVQPLCEWYGVDIVFCGHNHYYARCDKNGVKHITTGGGGAPLYTGSLNYSEYVEVYAKTHHFCKIHIHGRQLDFVAVKPDGTIIDEFALWYLPPEAWSPSPEDAAVHQSVNVECSWSAGAGMVNGSFDTHIVYFGTSFEDVNDGEGAGDPEYIDDFPGGTETFKPTDYVAVELWKTYFWRVDEKIAFGPTIKGDTWSFTTGCDIMPGDINLDCVVDLKDYAMLAEDWGEKTFFPNNATP
jgi:hypothetical protein